MEQMQVQLHATNQTQFRVHEALLSPTEASSWACPLVVGSTEGWHAAYEQPLLCVVPHARRS